MGNCLRHESPMQWGGDDWGSLLPPERTAKMEEEGLLAGKRGFTSSKMAATEVKVKISKKQLEKLLGRIDVQGLSVEQVVGQLMNVSDRHETHQRTWRPALQSIPEGN